MVYTDEQLARLLAACRSEAEQAKQANAKSVQEPAQGWRASARWLEQNFPEEYRDPPSARTSPITDRSTTQSGSTSAEPVLLDAREAAPEGADFTHPPGQEHNTFAIVQLPVAPTAQLQGPSIVPELSSAEPSCGTGSSVNCPNSEPVDEPTTLAPQCPRVALESSERVPTALPAPSPTPLAGAFWQSLLFGNPDALVSSSDTTRALHLVSDKLGVVLIDGETISTLRAGQLRKMLGERFGPNVWDVMNKLWRSAPASPGAPTPAADQSQLAPGPLPADRRWIRDLHDPDRIEREWLLDHGIGL